MKALVSIAVLLIPVAGYCLRMSSVQVEAPAEESATVTSYSVGNSSATALANPKSNRKRLIVYNDAGTLYVKLGVGASETSYTYRLTANTFQEIIRYSGIVTARKASGTTAVLVTEY